MNLILQNPATEKEGFNVSVLFDVEDGGDGTNLFLEQIATMWASPGGGKVSASLRGFLDSINTKDFYNYKGSSTFPPCQEGVTWAVLTEIQPISKAQLKTIADGFTVANARA